MLAYFGQRYFKAVYFVPVVGTPEQQGAALGALYLKIIRRRNRR